MADRTYQREHRVGIARERFVLRDDGGQCMSQQCFHEAVLTRTQVPLRSSIVISLGADIFANIHKQKKRVSSVRYCSGRKCDSSGLKPFYQRTESGFSESVSLCRGRSGPRRDVIGGKQGMEFVFDDS